MKDFLPFFKPDMGEKEISLVTDCLKSGWLTTGPMTRRFEEEFMAFIGGKGEALAVNSATSGLHLALEAIGVGAGDEVITTTHTFTATAEIIRYLGAHPVLVDIEPDTLNICPEAVEKAVTERTKAIIPVHFGGLSCDMDALFVIAEKHGLRIIEDAAHALPSLYKGAKIGTLKSAATVFSFYANKTMTTGEGGMIVSNDPDIIARCKVMRLHGISRDAFDRFTSEKPAWYYDVIAPGYKYNMTDIAAAIGVAQLEKVEDYQIRRQEIAMAYLEAFADLPVILPASARKEEGGLHSWHLFPIRILPDAGLSRDAIIDVLFEQGVGCSVHYTPLHRLTYWRETYNLKNEDFPHSEAAYKGAVTLPVYPMMTDDDVKRVIETVRGILA